MIAKYSFTLFASLKCLFFINKETYKKTTWGLLQLCVWFTVFCLALEPRDILEWGLGFLGCASQSNGYKYGCTSNFLRHMKHYIISDVLLRMYCITNHYIK